jgi:DNA-binding SARP family transcriptional activator
MQYRILGALEVETDGARADLGPPKQRALLAILLLHAGEIVLTDRLIDLLWGERAPRTASHSVQIYVSELRRSLEPGGQGRVIATRAPGYELRAEPDSIDARRFERLLDGGTRKIEAGDRDEGAAMVRDALGLWRGPALSDFAYEDFAQP